MTSKEERGARLRAARKAARLSQAQLSAQTGIDRSAISNMERGDVGLGPDRAIVIAPVLNVSPTDLLGSPEEEDAARAEEDRQLDNSLATLASKAKGQDALVAEVLQLLTRRLRLVESRVDGRGRRSTHR